jgi:H+/Cl- antiporter ClcA/CBS domain-containing protein
MALPDRAPASELGDFSADKRVLLLVAMALLVGLAGVGGAWTLLTLITLCTNLAYTGQLSLAERAPDIAALGAASALVPVVGSLIIGLMARYGSEKIRGHGIPEAMEAILIGQSRMSPKVALLKPLSSAISIGTGGPFGAEGPIIMTGGAIGSLFAQCFRLSSAERKTLLVAGAAAGMTAVFGTPVAAVMLAIELLLFEWKPRSFIPVLAACVVAAVARGAVLPAAPLFAHAAALPVTAPVLLGSAALGLVCGLGSGLLTTMLYAVEDLFARLPIHWMFWPALGGLAVGLGGLVEPRALGVGYDNIRQMLAGDMANGAVLSLLAVKALIWVVALGSGTSGGVLAPLLMMGGAVGAAVSGLLPAAGPGDWAVVGMAAMMGAAMRAPLTATLFAVELTGSPGLLLPLLAACGVGYGLTVLLLKRSILTEKVARRGHHVVREYRVDPFDIVRVGDVMVTEVDTLAPGLTAGEAVAFFSSGAPRHKSYPLVDAAGRPLAMLSRTDVLELIAAGGDAGRPVGTLLAQRPLITADAGETLAVLAARMLRHDVGRVPVINAEDGTLVGLVARKDLLKARARVIAEEGERRTYFKRRRLSTTSS